MHSHQSRSIHTMVSSITKSESAVPSGIKAPVQETLLTPRFYTTDFDKIAQMDLSGQEEELAAIMAELRADYNRHHFVRNREFEQCWAHIDGETRLAFIDFLGKSAWRFFQGVVTIAAPTVEWLAIEIVGMFFPVDGICYSYPDGVGTPDILRLDRYRSS